MLYNKYAMSDVGIWDSEASCASLDNYVAVFIDGRYIVSAITVHETASAWWKMERQMDSGVL